MIIMPPIAEAHFVLYCHYIIGLSVKQEKHRNPEFDHTHGEIKKNLQKSTLAFNGG
jgi:hypothetical protein